MGIDVGDLADVTDLSENFIKRYLSGDIPIPLDILEKLASVVNIEIL